MTAGEARTITRHEAAVVCHQFDLPGGYAGSGFTGGLVALMARADRENLGRLAQGFPGYAAAVRLVLAGRSQRLMAAAAGTESVPVGFCCPVCFRVSYHPMDDLLGYCGHCRAWTRLGPEPRMVADGPAAGWGVL